MSGVTNYQCPVCGVVVSSGHACAMSAIQARIDTLTAERDALVRAIDDAMTSAHIGVFNPGDDPKDAINRLAVYEQGVGEYFVKAERDAARREFTEWVDTTREELDAHAEVVADRDRLAACVERATEWIKVLADGEFTSPFKVDPLERAKSHIAAIEHSAADILAALEGA
jgi:hypothetical protein